MQAVGLGRPASRPRRATAPRPSRPSCSPARAKSGPAPGLRAPGRPPGEIPMTAPDHSYAELEELVSRRIVVLDGAMGSMIQTYRARRGGLPRRALRGAPAATSRATTTCSRSRGPTSSRRSTTATSRRAPTSSRPTPSAAPPSRRPTTSLASHRHRPERRRGGSAPAAPPTRPRRRRRAASCFVAGAIGPLNRTLSMSPDVNRPDYRAVTWDAGGRGLRRAGARAARRAASTRCWSRPSSTRSTAKAALFAIEGVFEELGRARAGDDLGHHHRRLGPHALGPDHQRLLRLDPPRQALQRGHQLRAGRRRDAPLHRGAGAASPSAT